MTSIHSLAVLMEHFADNIKFKWLSIIFRFYYSKIFVRIETRSVYYLLDFQTALTLSGTSRDSHIQS